MKTTSIFKINARVILVLVFLFFTLTNLLAQGPPPPGDGDDPGMDVPIDGGLSILIAAGLGYGAKKVIESRRKARELVAK